MVLVVAVAVVAVYLSICLSANLKTNLFCKTSSVLELDNMAASLRDFLNFELDNIKSETIRRDVLKFRS